MLNFVNDYSEGCFPEILDKFSQINFEKIAGSDAGQSYSAG